MTRKELEASLEARCVKRIEDLGGLALKLAIPGVRGFPDRTVLMPGANVFYVETKRLGSGRVSAQQMQWKVTLERLGFGCYLIASDAEFELALRKELDR